MTIDQAAKTLVASDSLFAHPFEHWHGFINVVIDDDLALGRIQSMQASDILSRAKTFARTHLFSLILPQLGQRCCPRLRVPKACRVTLHSPSCGHALVKTALSVLPGALTLRKYDHTPSDDIGTRARSPDRILRSPPQKACDGKGNVQ